MVTNCAIIALSPQVQEYYSLYGSLEVVLYIVVVEVRFQHENKEQARLFIEPSNR